MLLNLFQLKEKYNLNITGILHIGGHYGQEMSTYRVMNINNVIFFEPLPQNYEVLKKNVGGDVITIQTALGNTEGEIEMNVETANSGQSSSILEPFIHLKQYPHITFNHKVKVPITKLDNFIDRKDNYNFINIDVQGYELEVFKGGVEFLKHIDYIMTEVNRDEVYKNCAKIDELDNFLSQYGFVRVETTWDGGTWGDAFYIKKNKNMKIIKSEVLSQKLDFFDKYYDINYYPYLKGISEHYRLLSYLSKSFDNITIIDAGTLYGHSCLALSQNLKNVILTYDIQHVNLNFANEYKNVIFKKLDINEETPEVIKSATIILLDIDPHDGIQETKFINYLKQINYKGYVICDDIFLNEGMKNWWNSVDIEKYDLTDIGHFSGTGLINFNQDNGVIIL